MSTHTLIFRFIITFEISENSVSVFLKIPGVLNTRGLLQGYEVTIPILFYLTFL